jgi:hypothetical protein
MSDLAAGVLLLAAFAAVMYAAFAAAVFVSVWLLPLVIIGGGGAVGILAWKLANR